MIIVNLTMHPASPEQKGSGVVDYHDPKELKSLLLFNSIEELSPGNVLARADALAALAIGEEAAMIGGHPALMGPLVAALHNREVKALFAFSKRESVEAVQPDGSTRKVTVFRHLGFAQAAG